MPSVLVGAAVSGLGAYLTGATVAKAVGVFATQIVLGGIQRALAKDPQSSDSGAKDITVTANSPVASRRIIYGKRRLGGTYVYKHSTSDDSRLHFVVALCEGPIEAIDEIYFDGELAVQADGTVVSKYASVVQVSKFLGDPNQSADALAVQETPDSGNGEWTSDHRMRGVAGFYIQFQWDRDKFPQGVPNFSAVVRGRNDITDPRDSSTGYTTNTALCLAHYLGLEKYGLDASNAVDQDALKAAANVCDEDVTLKDGGTEKRYTCNGLVDLADSPESIIEDMVNAMAGWITYTGGEWVMRAGEYRTPEIELDEDDMHSSLEVTTRLSRRERFNGVRGTFVSPENNYQPADFPAFSDSGFVSADGGKQIWKDIELPYTASSATAQRLARIEVARARREKLVSGQFSLKAYRLAAGDTVELSYSRFSWSQVVFEVVDTKLEWNDDGSLGVDLSLRETDSAVYDWDPNDETLDPPAPTTDLPDPFTAQAPTNLTVQSGNPQLFPKKDGTVVSRIKITWDQSSGAFIRGYQVQYKKSIDSEWQNAGDVDNDNRVAWVWDVEDDEDYDVRVRAISELGVRSSWSTVSNHTVIGKTAPPPDPDTFDVVVQGDGTREFTFSLATPPADLAGFEVRYISGSSTDWDAMQTLTPQGRLVFSPFESNQVPAGLHSFGVKAIDTSGNPSDNAVFIEQNLPNPRLAGVLVQRVEKAINWPGTLNSLFRDTDNVLRAVAASDGTWGDLSGTTWADASGESWFSWTNRESPVSYETEVIDIGTDSNFTPRVTVSTTGTATIEMKTGSEADGGVTGSYTAITDVEGARYIQIRVTVSGTTPAIQSMTTLIDGEVEITGREDVDTANETAVWFNRLGTGHFQVAANEQTGAITRATIIAFQNITESHTFSLESKTATVNSNPAAEFKVFDSAGNPADVTVDIELKGPKVS